MRFQRSCFAVVPLLLVLRVPGMRGQTDAGSRALGGREFYAGYSYLSNAFNSHGEFSGGGLNGWDASFKLPLSSSFGIKIAAIGEYGSSLGDAQRAHFVMGGGQYGWQFGATSAYVQWARRHRPHQCASPHTWGRRTEFRFLADGGCGRRVQCSLLPQDGMAV